VHRGVSYTAYSLWDTFRAENSLLTILVPERIDQGVDFSGSGPVYALGDGIVTNAIAYSPGWGGGWITYQLSDGPDAGLVAQVRPEAVRPAAVRKALPGSRPPAATANLVRRRCEVRWSHSRGAP